MEKIRLRNGQEFELVPMGISDNSATKRRKFTFTSTLTYQEIENMFAVNDNISVIQHLDEVGEILTTYVDCTALKLISRNLELGAYTVELSVDAIEKELQRLKTEATITADALEVIIYMTMEV